MNAQSAGSQFISAIQGFCGCGLIYSVALLIVVRLCCMDW